MINIDPQVVHDKILSVGKKWAEADGEALLLEKQKDAILAQQVQKVVAMEPGIPITQAREKALASKGYIEYIQGMCAAREKANHAKVAYNSAQLWWEAMRTSAATLRTEMNTIGGSR